jgi:hypothetical protein
MKYFLATLAVIASAPLAATPAAADLACGSLLMPAGQLKQVSRGITRHHSGLDLVAPHGSPARAAAPGIVVAAQRYYAYGLIVDIDHGGGVLTRYAHLATFAPSIRPGAPVQAGQVIGTVGRTGRATTAHIHFEVRVNGRAVDPKPYLSLANCGPSLPTARFDVASGPAPGAARTSVAEAPRAPSPVAASAPTIEGRPGGLLE